MLLISSKDLGYCPNMGYCPNEMRRLGSLIAKLFSMCFYIQYVFS